MAEVQFADGKQVVDDVYVDLIEKATNGAPERFPFRDVMDRVMVQRTDDIFRGHVASIRREHFRQWG